MIDLIPTILTIAIAVIFCLIVFVLEPLQRRKRRDLVGEAIDRYLRGLTTILVNWLRGRILRARRRILDELKADESRPENERLGFNARVFLEGLLEDLKVDVEPKGEPCANCGGDGLMPCPACHGDGKQPDVKPPVAVPCALAGKAVPVDRPVPPPPGSPVTFRPKGIPVNVDPDLAKLADAPEIKPPNLDAELLATAFVPDGLEMDADPEEVKAFLEGAEASELPRPVENCGHVDPDDGTCGHPDAMTPECHEGADCPALEDDEHDPKLNPRPCPKCEGKGYVLDVRAGAGVDLRRATCPECNGDGRA